jgi:hypothetical protein
VGTGEDANDPLTVPTTHRGSVFSQPVTTAGRQFFGGVANVNTRLHTEQTHLPPPTYSGVMVLSQCGQLGLSSVIVLPRLHDANSADVLAVAPFEPDDRLPA